MTAVTLDWVVQQGLIHCSVMDQPNPDFRPLALNQGCLSPQGVGWSQLRDAANGRRSRKLLNLLRSTGQPRSKGPSNPMSQGRGQSTLLQALTERDVTRLQTNEIPERAAIIPGKLSLGWGQTGVDCDQSCPHPVGLGPGRCVCVFFQFALFESVPWSLAFLWVKIRNGNFNL